AEFVGSRLQQGYLDHSVDARPPHRIACCSLEEIHKLRLPLEPGAVEIERHFVGVAGLAEAMQLVLGHGARFLPCRPIRLQASMSLTGDTIEPLVKTASDIGGCRSSPSPLCRPC